MDRLRNLETKVDKIFDKLDDIHAEVVRNKTNNKWITRILIAILSLTIGGHTAINLLDSNQAKAISQQDVK